MADEGNASSVFYSTLLSDDLDLNESWAMGEASATPTGAPVPSWPCNHTGPVIMREKYPLPMLVDAAWTIDNYELWQIIIFALIFVVSLCGNVVVMVVVYQNSFLRSTVNYYLVNLAVSDLLITVLCWPTITTKFTFPFYILGRPLCKINVLTQITCVTASVMTLSAVACDRVYAVMLPLRARSSGARPLTLISIIWIIAIIVAIPAFLVRDVQVFQWDDLSEESCSDMLPRCNPNAVVIFKYYRILLTVILFFLPGLVMVAAYAVILLRLWCVKRPYNSSPSSTISSPNPHTRAKRKIVILTALVLLAFLISWSPLQMLIFYDLIFPYQGLPMWYEKVLFWAYFLGYCNSALNPLLYGGFSDNFRAGFRNLYKQRRSTSDHIQNPSSTGATSLSTYRGSFRFNFPRRSSLFRTSSNSMKVKTATNGVTTRCKSSPNSRRSSRIASGHLSRQSSIGISSERAPKQRQTNGVSLNMSPLPSQCEEVPLETTLNEAYPTKDSLKECPTTDCFLREERLSLLTEAFKDRKDISDFLFGGNCPCEVPQKNLDHHSLSSFKKPMCDAFASIKEESITFHDR